MWNSSSLLNAIAIWLTIGASVAPVILGILALVAEAHVAQQEKCGARPDRARVKRLTYATMIAPCIFGLMAIVAQVRAKHLEDNGSAKVLSVLNPRKQPIAAVSAFVEIRIRNGIKVNPERKMRNAVAHLVFSTSPRINQSFLPSLLAEKYEVNGYGDVAFYYLEFHMDPIPGAISPDIAFGNLVEKLDELNAVWLMLWFLPTNAEILGGSATLTVNSSTRRMFPIAAQNAVWGSVTSVVTNGVATPFHLGKK